MTNITHRILIEITYHKDKKNIPQTISRIVSMDSIQVYKDNQMADLYYKDTSPLRTFEKWLIEVTCGYQFQRRKNRAANSRNPMRFFKRVWRKLFVNKD